MVQTKIEWRRSLLETRRCIPETLRNDRSAAIVQCVQQLPCFAAARSLLGYVAIGAEVDPSPLVTVGAAVGVAVFLPALGENGEPRWVSWNGGRTIADASAESSSAADLSYPVLVIVPGVGFDRSGVRLGRGRGFYDRALADLRRHGKVYSVGIAFECQVVPTLPSDGWDQRVDFIATERRVLVVDAAAMAGEEARER